MIFDTVLISFFFTHPSFVLVKIFSGSQLFINVFLSLVQLLKVMKKSCLKYFMFLTIFLRVNSQISPPGDPYSLDWDTFPVTANAVDTILIPAFTDDSTLSDAIRLFDFFLALPNSPVAFLVYRDEEVAICDLEDGVYSCSGDSATYYVLDAESIEAIYNSSRTPDFVAFLRIAQLIVEQSASLCSNTPGNCFVTRTNFVVLTDSPEVQIKSQLTVRGLHEILYFGISTSQDFNKNATDSDVNGNYQSVQMFFLEQNVSPSDVSEILFSDKLRKFFFRCRILESGFLLKRIQISVAATLELESGSTPVTPTSEQGRVPDSTEKSVTSVLSVFDFQPFVNGYNVYIVGDESILEHSIELAEYLVLYGDPIYTGWNALAPRFYVASVKRNDTCSYQTGKLFRLKFLRNLYSL